jgi:hypothetical protein
MAQMCSVIIRTGGRRCAGMVAMSRSAAVRNTAKARSPASRSSGLASGGMPASNIAE